MKQGYLNKLALVAIAGAFCACTSKIQKADLPITTNPTDEIGQIERQMQVDVQNHVNVLAPEEYKQAASWLQEAKDDVRDNQKQNEIIDDLRYALAYQQKAQALSQDRALGVKSILEARTKALQTGALNYESTKNAIDKLDSEMASAAKNFNKYLSAEDQSRIQQGYMKTQVAAVIASELNGVRAKIKAVGDAGGYDKIPNTMQKAKVDLANAENTIEKNVNDRSEYRSAVNQSKASSVFMVRVWEQTRKNKGIAEGVAVELAEKNNTIADLKAELDVSQEDVSALDEKLENQAATIEIQKAIENARAQFTDKEAEVFQQGNNLVIRLKTLAFPTGSASLSKSSMNVVAKANSVISGLDASKVVVEGHTDSVGAAALNKKLSMKRAETVANYLKVNGSSEDTEIKAVGVGYEKPLASNKDKNGRAQNRRVDIIVTIAQAPSSLTSSSSH